MQMSVDSHGTVDERSAGRIVDRSRSGGWTGQQLDGLPASIVKLRG